jgi:hypothetical protein
MNIVYLLTNKTKTSGKRFYIGSKSECKIVKINGVDTMISVTTGKVYMSSSKSEEFRQDLLDGHVFEVTVLENVGGLRRKELTEIENSYIIKNNAVESAEYYNLSYAVLNSRCGSKIANKYGETIGNMSNHGSSISKRDNNAIKLGYANFGEFVFDAYRRYKECGNYGDVSRYYGRHRGYVRMNLLPYNMEKALIDLNRDCLAELRAMLADNCSLVRACEILDIELPAGRVLLGDYIKDRNFGAAFNKGMSKEELEIEITRRILNGEGFREVSNDIGVTYVSVKRYFLRCVRKRLKASDL